jgi:hypothetical protein
MPSNMADQDLVIVVFFQELKVNSTTIVWRTPTNFQVLLHHVFDTFKDKRSFQADTPDYLRLASIHGLRTRRNNSLLLTIP